MAHIMERVASSYAAAIRELDSRIVQGAQPQVSYGATLLGPEWDFFNPNFQNITA